MERYNIFSYVLSLGKSQCEAPCNCSKSINCTSILKKNNTSKPQHKDIKEYSSKFSYLNRIKVDCGELCDTTRKGKPGLFFPQIEADVDCNALFHNNDIDIGHNETRAPRSIPLELLSDFDMDKRIRVSNLYFDRKYMGGKAMTPIWKKKDVEKQIQQASNGTLKGSYGILETNNLIDGLKHAPGVKGGRILVIGSERPWAEAAALSIGAKEVITLEYGGILSEHPNIRTLTPADFRKSFLNGTLGEFDGVASFSSLEHTGLGRYGDALNPWGDIIAVARAWCVTKKGGSLTIGVPYIPKRDYLAFNEARHYGDIRYPYLVTNWIQLYRVVKQSKFMVHVLQKGNK